MVLIFHIYIYRLTMEKPHKSSQTNSWDILIFTQTWPYTLCYSWKLENASHTCNMPPVKDLWSIHGIWFVIIFN